MWVAKRKRRPVKGDQSGKACPGRAGEEVRAESYHQLSRTWWKRKEAIMGRQHAQSPVEWTVVRFITLGLKE